MAEEVKQELTETTPGQQGQEAERILGQVTDFTYVNASFASVSNWDVRFVFGERLPSDNIEPRAAIVMSHQQAKALSEMLARNIEKLEAVMGPIRWQPPAPKKESPKLEHPAKR